MDYFDYPGPVSNFRAFMEGALLGFKDGTIKTDDNIDLRIDYAPRLSAPAREGWYVARMEENEKGTYTVTEQRATILALEEMPNSCMIYIHDGILYDKDFASMTMKGIGKPLGALLDILVSRMSKQLSNKMAFLKKPQTRDLNEWFRYYYDCKSAGKKFTLRNIAEETSYHHDYIRQLHLRYKVSRGIK
jgi:hypothetical protein